MDAEDGDYPPQIVGEDVEAHFGTDPFQPSGQEVCRTHPCLDGSERMFDRLPADPREFNSARAAFSNKALDGLHVADHDRALAEIDQAPTIPVLEDLVRALPAAARHIPELALRDVQFG